MLLFACSAGTNDSAGGSGQGASGQGPAGTGGNPTNGPFMTGTGGNTGCPLQCSPALHNVIDCMGNIVASCSGFEGCNPVTLTCANACQNAIDAKQSVGCEYFAVDMDQNNPSACFAAYVANTWNTPVKIEVEFNGSMLSTAGFARIPQG